MVAIVQPNRRSDGVEQTVCDSGDLVGRSHMPTNQQELVTTQSTHDITFASREPQAIRDHLQQTITHLVTQAVIDHLEPVQVAEHHSHSLLGGQQHLETLEQLLTIGQAGQQVVAGLERQLRLELATIGEVSIRHGVGLENSFAIANTHNDRRHRLPFAIAIDQFQLAHPCLAPFDRSASIVEDQRAVFNRNVRQ